MQAILLPPMTDLLKEMVSNLKVSPYELYQTFLSANCSFRGWRLSNMEFSSLQTIMFESGALGTPNMGNLVLYWVQESTNFVLKVSEQQCKNRSNSSLTFD